MLIGGLERATSGRIFFQNHEITKLNEDEVSEIRKKNIGIIFQSFYLIPNYTAVENIALTLELNKFKNPEKEAKHVHPDHQGDTNDGRRHGAKRAQQKSMSDSIANKSLILAGAMNLTYSKSA